MNTSHEQRVKNAQALVFGIVANYIAENEEFTPKIK